MSIKDHILKALAALDSPIIVELGAHRGADTRWLRAACKGSPIYIAVEPDERHFPYLRDIPGIHPFRCAIASYGGDIDFYPSGDERILESSRSSSIRKPALHAVVHPEITFDRSVIVPCMTLDGLAWMHGLAHIDLLWVDIQGAEKDMVEGGRKILGKTDWIFVESYRQEMYEGQALRNEFLGMLWEFETVEENYDYILLRRKALIPNVIIFSKNRAAQLDLLLKSMERFAPSLFPAKVLYIVTGEGHSGAYGILEATCRLNVSFVYQGGDFRDSLLAIIDPEPEQTVLLVDDDVFYRPAPVIPRLKPSQCFSFRLGLNVVRDWQTGTPQCPSSDNFRYAWSLDGHVFRTDELLALMRDLEFDCPNRLEAAMQRRGPALEVLYDQQSSLVGIPHNLVQTAWPQHSMGGSAAELNERFLAGERIYLDLMDFSGVDSTHMNIPYAFKPGSSNSAPVSVVIPNLDYGRYLAQTIESVLAQTVPPREIILADGGSTDDSLEVAARYPQVRVIHASGTQGASKNRGIEQATSPYIICLDSDDYIAPTYIEKCLAKITDCVGLVSTGIQCFGDQANSWNPPDRITLADMLQSNPIFCASMFRKAAWLEAGKFDENERHEDWDLWIKIMLVGWQIAVVPKPLFNYRFHSASVTHNLSQQKLTDMIHERYKHIRSCVTEAAGMTIQLPHERDRYVVDEVIVNDCYHLRELVRLIPAPTTIVDVGGNIGTFGLLAKSLWPEARLIAYEPNKQSATLYERNMRANGRSNVQVCRQAVSYEPEKTVLAEHKGYPTGGGILTTEDGVYQLPGGVAGEREVSETDVHSVTMDAVVGCFGRIDLLKLDCEGSEVEIVRQMKPETASRIALIVGEYHVDGGYSAFENLVRTKFPVFDMTPLGPRAVRIGMFAAGPPDVISKLLGNQGMGAPQAVVTPGGSQVRLLFNDGAFVHISEESKTECTVRFDNMATGENVYTKTIGPGRYAAANPRYRVPWRVTVTENGVEVLRHEMDLRGKRVLVVLTSSALGDTVAWMPYADELRQQCGCQVEVETFWKDLFDTAYPEIKFHNPGDAQRETYYATYLIGAWDGDGGHRNRVSWRTIPLQQVASDVLDLEYREIRPKIRKSDLPAPKEKYVAVSEFSAFQVIGTPERAYSRGYTGKQWAQSKWQETANYLSSLGYAVASVSKEPTQLEGVLRWNDRPMEETIRNIQYADLFIGVSSGLAWVAWALGVPVILISGMTPRYVEMQDCHRVINESVCHGCFNDTTYPLNRADPEWCPRGKSYECTTSITLVMVKNAINSALSGGQSKTQFPEAVGVHRWRVLEIVPHLSTGGLPQYTLNCVRDLIAAGAEVRVLEWNYYGPDFVVQRKQIEDMGILHSFNGVQSKQLALQNMLSKFAPEIVHLQERAEYFLNGGECRVLYNPVRRYRIVETSHDSSFAPIMKGHTPDSFVVVCQHHADLCRQVYPNIPCTVVEYSTPYQMRPDRTMALSILGLDTVKKHVLNVGLFTPGKNQGEAFEVARLLPDVQFHFVGNQAGNFAHYWEPLMRDKPPNCTVWGERNDVDRFYAAMDVLLFTSTSELAPLVPKEALAWGMPVLMRDLPIYKGAFARPGVRFINGDLSEMAKVVMQITAGR